MSREIVGEIIGEIEREERSSSQKLDTPSIWTIVNIMRKAIRHIPINIYRLELQKIDQLRINNYKKQLYIYYSH